MYILKYNLILVINLLSCSSVFLAICYLNLAHYFVNFEDKSHNKTVIKSKLLKIKNVKNYQPNRTF